LHQKFQIQDYQTKDRLSVLRILLLQRKPKLGSTKHSTGPHVASRPRVGIAGLKLGKEVGMCEIIGANVNLGSQLSSKRCFLQKAAVNNIELLHLIIFSTNQRN